MRNEILQVKEVLKLIIKSKGLQYEDLSKMTGFSKATIKRMLNADDISLGRLVDLCDYLDVNFFEVIERSARLKKSKYHFSKKQELFLAKRFENFKFFRLLVLDKSINSIKKILNISDIKSMSILKELENHKLIERIENDQVKLLAHFPYEWSDNGPLEKKYNSHIADRCKYEVLKSGINRNQLNSQSKCRVVELMLTEKSKLCLEKEIGDALERYKSISAIEMQTSHDDCTIFSALALSGSFSWWANNSFYEGSLV